MDLWRCYGDIFMGYSGLMGSVLGGVVGSLQEVMSPFLAPFRSSMFGNILVLLRFLPPEICSVEDERSVVGIAGLFRGGIAGNRRFQNHTPRQKARMPGPGV